MEERIIKITAPFNKGFFMLYLFIDILQEDSDMKKYVLITLLVLALSFSTMVTAESLEGFFISLENIPNLTMVEIQAVSAPDFGGVAVLSVDLSEQVVIDNKAVSASADIGLEMETIVKSYNIKYFAQLTIISELRGGYLHFASHYQQLTLII